MEPIIFIATGTRIPSQSKDNDDWYVIEEGERLFRLMREAKEDGDQCAFNRRKAEVNDLTAEIKQ